MLGSRVGIFASQQALDKPVLAYQWDASDLSTVLKDDGNPATTEGDVIKQWIPKLGTVLSTTTFNRQIKSGSPNTCSLTYSTTGNKYGISKPVDVLLNLPSSSIPLGNKCIVVAMRFLVQPVSGYRVFHGKSNYVSPATGHYNIRTITLPTVSVQVYGTDKPYTNDAFTLNKVYVSVFQVNSAGNGIARLFPSNDAESAFTFTCGTISENTVAQFNIGGMIDSGNPNYTVDLVVHEYRWYNTTVDNATVANINEIVAEMYAKWV